MHTKSDWNGFLFLTSPSKSKDADLSAAWKSHDGLSPTIQTWNSKVAFWGESSLTDCWSWPLTLWWEVFLDEGNCGEPEKPKCCVCDLCLRHVCICLFVFLFTCLHCNENLSYAAGVFLFGCEFQFCCSREYLHGTCLRESSPCWSYCIFSHKQQSFRLQVQQYFILMLCLFVDVIVILLPADWDVIKEEINLVVICSFWGV